MLCFDYVQSVLEIQEKKNVDSMKLFLNIIGSVFVCSMFVFEDFFVYFILVLVLELLRDVDYYLEVMLMIVLFRNFRLRF